MKQLLNSYFCDNSKSLAQNLSYEKQNIYKTKFDDAIPVLNVATFHMVKLPDE